MDCVQALLPEEPGRLVTASATGAHQQQPLAGELVRTGEDLSRGNRPRRRAEGGGRDFIRISNVHQAESG